VTALGFCLEELVRHLREHRGVAMLSTATMALAFFLLSMLVLVWVNVQAMTRAAAEELHVRVYLRDSADATQRDGLRARLEREAAVRAVTYVSKEEALSRFKAQLKDQAVLLEGLGDNPLPASFDVVVREEAPAMTGLTDLIDRIQAEPGVESVRYGQEWLTRFRVVLAFVRVLALGVGAVAAAVVVAIMANTIRFVIDARRREIAVLKIVGASPTVIVLPYVLEGLLLGACSVLLGLGMLAALVMWAGPSLEAAGGFLLGRSGLLFLPVDLIALLLVVGAVLGGLGSLVALRRHLRLSTV
jgi:cell division transport system permease protein